MSNTDHIERQLALCAMGQLALTNASVLIQATSGGRTGFWGDLQKWLDEADENLRELREALAKEREPV